MIEKNATKEAVSECKTLCWNLPFETTDETLQEHFASQGTVVSAKVILDRFTGRSRGFGFVEMSTQEEGEQAIANLHGTDLGGRILVVNEARPMEPRRPPRSESPNT